MVNGENLKWYLIRNFLFIIPNPIAIGLLLPIHH